MNDYGDCPRLARFYVVLAAISLGFFTACGDDGEGNEDTLLTGFSGFVILCLVIFFVYRWAKNRRG